MIRIICLGKIKEKYLNDMINDYFNRINKYHKLEIIELKDSENILQEEKEILNILDTRDYNIALCIDGKKFNSVAFADKINNIFSHNGKITFIIGGSNGISELIQEKCNEKISFSEMTFPHGLFRAILLEQIYRSFKINNNETYHK